MKILSQIFLSAWLVSALAAPAAAENQGQWYFGASGMLAAARDSKVDEATGTPDPAFTTDAELVTKVGYGASLYGGWLYNSNWRAELELSRRAVSLDKITGLGGTVALEGDLTVHTVFLNAARDFRTQAWITPYIGAGIGYAFHELSLDRAGTSGGLPQRTTGTLAFQGMFGIEMEAADDIDIVLGYRYVNYYAPDYDEVSFDFVDTHNFELGLRFYPEDW